MITEFKREDSQLTSATFPPVVPEKEPSPECEVCGLIACECPRPLGECCECRVPIFEAEDAWMVDSEGGHYCQKCWPGGDA